MSVKFFTSIFLLLLLSFGMFLKVGIVGYYYANQSYIIATLCENKDNPVMHCNGKCYLKKQLKKADESENQKPLPTQSETTEFQPYIFTESKTQRVYEKMITYPLNTVKGPVPGYSCSVFHPPAA